MPAVATFASTDQLTCGLQVRIARQDDPAIEAVSFDRYTAQKFQEYIGVRGPCPLLHAHLCTQPITLKLRHRLCVVCTKS
jgi:hypothetical protein